MAKETINDEYKYVANISENFKIRGTGDVYGNTLNEVRKALYQKAKTVRWHRRTYLGGLHPQYYGNIWEIKGKHICSLVYDTGTNRILQGDKPATPTSPTTKWRPVRSDGSLGGYVDFSTNLI